MNRRILAIVVSGAVALPMAALAQDEEVKVPQHSHPGAYEHEHEMAGEDGAMMMVPAHAHQYDVHPAGEHGHDELHGHSATLYGSLRYGVTLADDGKSGTYNTWDLGSNRSSRFGVKGSMKAGAGLTAGFHLERALNSGLTERHHNVSLSGAFGTVKFGRQSSPFYGATTWDGSQTLGGITDPIFRTTGASFSSALGGPFNFAILMSANADAGTGTGSDHVEASGSLAAGPVTLTAAYMNASGLKDVMDDSKHMGGTVGGTVGPINWHTGFVSSTDQCGDDCDQERYGFHVGYAIGDGNVYTQYSELDSDMDAEDKNGWVFGYSHVLADNVVVYAEHGATDMMDAAVGEITAATTVFALKVGF